MIYYAVTIAIILAYFLFDLYIARNRS